MEIKMVINDEELDSIKVYAPMSENEHYIKWLKESLCQKHHYLLQQLESEPRFLLQFPSKTEA